MTLNKQDHRLDAGDFYDNASIDETNVKNVSVQRQSSFDFILPAFALEGITTRAVAKDKRRPHTTCSTPQGMENTEKFVSRVRTLFDIARLHKCDMSEEAQLDVVYRLLHSRIKTKIRREEFSTFDELLHHAHEIENGYILCSWNDRVMDVYLRRYGVTDDDDLNVEGDDDDSKVEMLSSTSYCTSFPVSDKYLFLIIGKKGTHLKRIQSYTRTKIKLSNGICDIFGPSEADVRAASRIIKIIMEKYELTHFICLPMNNSTIMNNFQCFKESVLRECADSRGLEESLFSKFVTLHLTLGVMSLMDNEERVIAESLFDDAMKNIVAPMLRDYIPYKIRLKGLAYMKNDSREIHVLYAKVEEVNAPKDTLQNIANAIDDWFYRAGFLREMNERHVTLHMTLLNTAHRQNLAPVDEDCRPPRLSFDGCKILEKFGDYDFGVMEVEEIHLSHMEETREDGIYLPTCIYSCNSS